MISYVKGILAEKAKDRIVVESGMMGIGIFVPMSVLEVLPPLGEEVKIYTHLQVREDDMSLYGFLSRSDLEMFRQLLGVNGIGPKGALGILSALRPEDLRVEEIHDNEPIAGLIGYVRERNYKGMTLDSEVEMENGKRVMVSEFFNEDDPDVDHSLNQKIAVTWVESWEVVLGDENDA